MNEKTAKTYADFALPPSVVTRVDISRLVNEVERVDNELTAAAVRAKAGASEKAKPVLSDVLLEFMNVNKLTAATSMERTALIKQLRLLKDKAPVVHMTFAVAADRESLQELVAWFRQSVHPQTIISVGLQPALVAGVYVRTPNQVRDLSLRAMVQNSHGALVKELEALGGRS